MGADSSTKLRETLYHVDVTSGTMTVYQVDEKQVLHFTDHWEMRTGLRREGTMIHYEFDRIPLIQRSRIREGKTMTLTINQVGSHEDGYCDNALWTWHRDTAELVKKACRVAADAAHRSKLDSGFR